MVRHTLFLCLFLAACGAPASATDAGTDAGTLHCNEPRACDLIGTWNVAVSLGRDAGGPFSPCLPLPQLDRTFSLRTEGGAWCSTFPVSWAGDAGCALALDYAFTSTNPSETYRHEIHLELSPADGGLAGQGTYRLTSGSNCTEPLTATAGRSPP